MLREGVLEVDARATTQAESLALLETLQDPVQVTRMAARWGPCESQAGAGLGPSLAPAQAFRQD